ncbi:condensation domain-containing protein [Bacillus sp. SL00103]
MADGASMNIFIKELLSSIEGETLPELTVQYKDYAEWQDKYFRDEMFQKQSRIIGSVKLVKCQL